MDRSFSAIANPFVAVEANSIWYHVYHGTRSVGPFVGRSVGRSVCNNLLHHLPFRVETQI